MALTLTKAAADGYFATGKHIMATVWTAFDTNLATAALAQATLLISRVLRTDVEDEEVAAEDFYQPDYAVFEQALWMLRHSDAVANGNKRGPKYLGADPDDTEQIEKKSDEDIGLVCDEALRWMQRPSKRVEFVRG